MNGPPAVTLINSVFTHRLFSHYEEYPNEH